MPDKIYKLQSITSVQADLDNYYTKSEVNALVEGEGDSIYLEGEITSQVPTRSALSPQTTYRLQSVNIGADKWELLSVEANTETDGTEDDLTSLTVEDTTYKLASASVLANLERQMNQIIIETDNNGSIAYVYHETNGQYERVASISI